MDARRRFPLILLLGWLLVVTGCEIAGEWNPAARRWLGGRAGRASAHHEEKMATFLLGYGMGIAGACLGLLRRPILGFSLIGVCYLIEAVRYQVFYVWEGGRLFDQDHRTPWIYLMLSLPMFWIAYKDFRDREHARAVLEEVN